MTELEKEIKEAGERLRQVSLEMAKETDKYSEKYLDLHHERNNLRKRIMDLDYEHKCICSNVIR